MTIPRVILMILDSVGAGATPDAAAYGDEGAGTLANTALAVGGLRLPNLERLGLGHITPITGVEPIGQPQAAFGRLRPVSQGKDSTTGHWELAGLELEEPFATFADGFPRELIRELEHRTGRDVLANIRATDQMILDGFGEKHLATGGWIVYTGTTSTLEIAVHENLVPRDELNQACRIARRVADPFRVARVIGRPFRGRLAGEFSFTERRYDFVMPPPGPTVFDRLRDYGIPVVGVGRIDELFAEQGISEKIPSHGNTDTMIKTIEAMARLDRGLFVTNLADFDVRYGHQRDPAGYARCLEEFDVQLAMLLSRADDEDLVLLTADHGNDPTRPGQDHTREYAPILAIGPTKAAGVDLGVRRFADVGATIAEVFGVAPTASGESFLPEIS